MTSWPGVGDITDICLFFALAYCGKLWWQKWHQVAEGDREPLLWKKKLATSCLQVFLGGKRSWGKWIYCPLSLHFPLVVALNHGAESHVGKLIIYGFLFWHPHIFLKLWIPLVFHLCNPLAHLNLFLAKEHSHQCNSLIWMHDKVLGVGSISLKWPPMK